MIDEPPTFTSENDTGTKLAGAVRGVLNRHGYSFQYSVIRTVEDLFTKEQTKWVFEAAEFPVNVRGKDTRIDLILRQRDSQIHLIGECKRANPALSNWCFARAPYIRKNSTNQKLIIQNVLLNNGGAYPGITSGRSDKIYHLGFEVKSDLKGEANADGRGSIEQAAAQVCLGANGMLDFFGTHKQFKETSKKIKYLFMPVVFTTARILTSQVDLGSADIKTGLLAADSVNVVEEPWIWLNYSLSPSFKHSQQLESSSLSLGDVLEADYIRSIIFVSPGGMEDFLKQQWRFE